MSGERRTGVEAVEAQRTHQLGNGGVVELYEATEIEDCVAPRRVRKVSNDECRQKRSL